MAPLFQPKAKKDAESKADSPQDGFSIAMAVKRKAPKRMSDGGMTPDHEQGPSSVAEAIMSKRKAAQADSQNDEAALKELYADSDDYMQDLTGADTSEEAPEDFIGAIRKRMKMKRGE